MEQILSALKTLMLDQARLRFVGSVAAFCALTLLSVVPAALAQPTISVNFNTIDLTGVTGAVTLGNTLPTINADPTITGPGCRPSCSSSPETIW